MNKELVKITKTSAVMTLDGIGVITMNCDAGRETKKIIVANETANKSNLALCESLARIKSTESYKSVLNSDGENITPTFSDFAEKVLGMSKGGASGYASVGEIFRDHLLDGWKYGHFVLMLKLRKILDDNGEPITGDEILEMLEEHGATVEMSTRALDELIKNLLATGESEDASGDGDGDGDGEESTEEISITTAFDVIRRALESNGLYEEYSSKLSELENLF